MSAMDSDSGSEMEDVTVTRTLPINEDVAMEEDTPMDLSLLAATARMTELSYTVAEIQTRLFEIQELRHVDDSVSSGDASLAIERALAALMESIVSVSSSLDEVNAAVAPVLESVKTPTQEGQANRLNEHESVLRKHASLLAEWQTVQVEVSRLRSELQEDQLLVRFRTAVEQAAGMMDSLDKAVEACQEFIWRRSKALRLGPGERTSQKNADVFAHFAEVVDHYERVKKYYMQSSTQAMASIDKTMRSRDIKNGEVLRRHTELSARWKSIRERIARTDREIEALKRPPDPEPSEAGSVRSRTTTSSRPDSMSTSMSTSDSLALSTLSQSISPFRKLASRVANGFRTPGKGKDKSGNGSGGGGGGGNSSGGRENDKAKSRTTPRSAIKSMPPPPHPRVTSPIINTRVTSPTRPAAQSIFSSPSFAGSALNLSGRGTSSGPPKPRWNISIKPEEDMNATVKPSPPRPSLQGHGRQMSLSGRQSSMSGRQTPSSRAYDPNGTTTTPRSAQRPNASRPHTPHGSGVRKRPTSPSNIPGPIEIDIGPPSLQRTLATPVHGPSLQAALSPPANGSPELMSFLTPPKARRASHSKIPAPMFRPSRPTSPSVSSTSYFPDGSTSPSTTFMSAAASPIGPNSPSPFNTFGPSLSTGPFYAAGQNTSQSALSSPLRTPNRTRAPPSSFRGATPMPTTSRSQSRPSSRASDSGRRSSLDRPAQSISTADLTYVPNPKDALDVELARVANSLVHGFHIARVTPIVPGVGQGPESSAQYAFTNALGKKVLACKLVVVEKSAPRGSVDGAVQQQRRVICRVGGGWESLTAFLERSA
ncbi:hypothetical protein BDV93DRAFT_527855 [Ceratobasidium sp. AG-I]|nr:hypothetical protein BDV93DRAFT_527855 [Ceratobasidium sp. AG-I]